MKPARTLRRSPGIFWLSALLIGPGVCGVAGADAKTGDAIAGPRLSQLQIEISSAGLNSLRGDPRTRVPASWSDGGIHFTNVVVRVKGRVGSFRPVDDRPSLTVDFDPVDPGQRWRGCRRIHLNNSVEDPSFQHEWMAAEVFRAAGIPIARVSHAVVFLNGRRLGLYVLKEGITPEFLERHFPAPVGNLYEPEPGPGCDVDGPMHLNPGAGPSDRTELQTLAEAAREPDLARRWERLGTVLDRDRFIDYVALEILLGHRDGYALARNNYRLYHDPKFHRFHFIPSGLDRLFGRADVPLLPRFAGRLAEAVMTTAEGRAALPGRIATLFTRHLVEVDWPRRLATQLETVTPEITRAEARSLRRESADLADRIRHRIDFVRRQLAEPRAEALRFTNGFARLSGENWRPVDPPEGGRLERGRRDGRDVLSIVAGPRTSASWRCRVQLAPGKYHLEITVLTRALKPLPVGRNHGVTVTGTVLGSAVGVARWVTGASDWTPMQVLIEVPADGGLAGPVTSMVELACLLRASAGEAWFDVGSARIRRVDR